MLSIKEASRYANYLEKILNQLDYLFTDSKNYIKEVEHHYKSKYNSDAEDVEIADDPNRIFSGQIHSLYFLFEDILTEKALLSVAINNAKKDNYIDWSEKGINLDINSAVEFNKRARSYCDSLSYLISSKNRTEKTTARDYMINAEGNQVPYNYTVEKIYTLDFDANIIKTKYKKLLEKTDKISTLIDEYLLKEIVDFTPKYSIHDSLIDIIEDFESKK